MPSASPPPTDAEEGDALHCPQCGYNLTGLTEHRCPECGTQFDPVALRTARRDRLLSKGLMIWQLLTMPALVMFAYVYVLMLAGTAADALGWDSSSLLMPSLALPVGALAWHGYYLARRHATRQRLIAGRHPEPTGTDLWWRSLLFTVVQAVVLVVYVVALGGCAIAVVF